MSWGNGPKEGKLVRVWVHILLYPTYRIVLLFFTNQFLFEKIKSIRISKISFWIWKIKISPLLPYFISSRLVHLNDNLIVSHLYSFHLTSFLRPDNSKKKLTSVHYWPYFFSGLQTVIEGNGENGINHDIEPNPPLTNGNHEQKRG